MSRLILRPLYKLSQFNASQFVRHTFLHRLPLIPSSGVDIDDAKNLFVSRVSAEGSRFDEGRDFFRVLDGVWIQRFRKRNSIRKSDGRIHEILHDRCFVVIYHLAARATR